MTKSELENVNGALPKMPWIEEIEIRTRTNDFRLNDQQYTVRISPSTPKKRKAQASLLEHIANRPDYDLERLQCAQNHQLYNDWVALYIIERNIQLLDTLKLVFRDKEIVLNRLVSSLEQDIDDVVDIQVELTDVNIAYDNLLLDKKEILSYYGMPDAILVFDDFINESYIASKINVVEDPLVNARMKRLQFEKEELSKELILEEAEKKQIFDFAQVRYEGPHTDFFNERLSVALGFRFPNEGNRKIKMQELALEQDQFDQEMERELLEQKADQDRSIQDLNLAMERQAIFQNYHTIETEKIARLADYITEDASITPMTLLDINERKVKSKLKLLDLTEDIFDAYIQYLRRSNLLCTESSGVYLRK